MIYCLQFINLIVRNTIYIMVVDHSEEMEVMEYYDNFLFGINNEKLRV